MGMTVHMTIAIDEVVNDRLRRLADIKNISPEELVGEVLAEHLDYDRWFRAKVREGIEAADRGDLIDHDEVFARLHERMSKAALAAE